MKTSELIQQQSGELLSRRALSQRWGVCIGTIKRREREGILKPIRFNQRMLRFRLSDIVAVEAAASGQQKSGAGT